MTVAASEVIEAVQKRLRETQPEGVRITIVADAVRKDKDWWYVPVQVSEPMPPSYLYYDMLSEAEEKLGDIEGLNVLPVPAATEEKAS